MHRVRKVFRKSMSAAKYLYAIAAISLFSFSNFANAELYYWKESAWTTPYPAADEACHAHYLEPVPSNGWTYTHVLVDGTCGACFATSGFPNNYSLPRVSPSSFICFAYAG